MIRCSLIYLLRSCGCCFFFSSRRRHTRLQGDWSSDVCSSDLEPLVGLDDRRQDLGAGRGGVVAVETHAVSYSMRQRKDQAPKARNASAVAARYRDRKSVV